MDSLERVAKAWSGSTAMSLLLRSLQHERKKLGHAPSRMRFSSQSGEVLEVFEAVGVEFADAVHVQVQLRGLGWQP